MSQFGMDFIHLIILSRAKQKYFFPYFTTWWCVL